MLASKKQESKRKEFICWSFGSLLSLQEISFPRLIVVPLSMSEPDGARNQEQIAASHEIDGVRKEKERLTAASLNKLPLDFSSLCISDFLSSFGTGCNLWSS